MLLDFIQQQLRLFFNLYIWLLIAWVTKHWPWVLAGTVGLGVVMGLYKSCRPKSKGRLLMALALAFVTLSACAGPMLMPKTGKYANLGGMQYLADSTTYALGRTFGKEPRCCS